MKKTDPVAAFLHRRTFFCVKLVANLTPEECATRQKREVTEARFGQRFIRNNDPQSRYCRSGECQQGKEQIVKLRARKAKAKAARAAKRAATP